MPFMRLGLLNLGLFAIAIIAFVLLCGEYMYFTIDDSFITYRYSDNMASGFPFSFNYNDEPEFGFTSYLYTIIVALGIKLGFDPIIFSKAVTIFSSISIMFLVSYSVRIFTENKFKLYFLAALPLAFTPYFAFHSVIGMETTLFASLFLASVVSYACFLKKDNKYFLFLAIIFSIFSIFTRYESVLVPIAFFIYLVYQKIFLKEGIKIHYVLINFVPIIFLISLLLWNMSLFGQYLPSPFYVKESRELVDVTRSVAEILTFLTYSSPFLLLILLKLKTHLKNKFSSFLIIQTVVSLFPFIFITQWINPFHRYYIHELPVLIIIGFLSLYLLKDKLEIGRYSKLSIAVVLIFLITFNLTSSSDVTKYTFSQAQGLETTHITIGKILGKYEELSHNTIATVPDAGAIPYFSKWQTYDYVLNDKITIQKGFSIERFYDTNPKFIFFYSTGNKNFESMEIVKQNFIDENSVAATGHHDEIVNSEKFKNYDLIAVYPDQFVFVEKEFVNENPELMDELIKNSIHGR